MSGVQVAFHFNAVDPLGYTCRLLNKALGRGARLVVCADAAALNRLDQQLWTAQPLSFLPHARPDAPPHVLACSPIWLRTHLTGDEPADVLVNALAGTHNVSARPGRVNRCNPDPLASDLPGWGGVAALCACSRGELRSAGLG